MNKNEIFQELRNRNEPVPIPGTLPTSDEITEIERILNCKLPVDFIDYLLQVSDVVYGILEPVNATSSESHNYIISVFNNFSNLKKFKKIESELFPICEDNGDFYCMDSDGKIHFISHEYDSHETWASIFEWIELVWLES